MAVWGDLAVASSAGSGDPRTANVGDPRSAGGPLAELFYGPVQVFDPEAQVLVWPGSDDVGVNNTSGLDSPLVPLPAGGPPVLWQPAPGQKVPPEGFAFRETSSGSNAAEFRFEDGNRWTSTTTDGGGLVQGDPTTLTWSIVPDGTSVAGFANEPTSASNLRAFLGNIYGVNTNDANLTDEPWFGLFENYLERWGEVSGLSYVYEPNDDGAAFSQFSLPNGQLGVRGDIRIAGHFIDGEVGSNILAYNFFPNVGDMVIDTGNPSFYGSTSNNSRALRNVLSHEHGHGLGVDHVCPVISSADGRLMEPFINLNFDGPQFDDILAVQRGYGDALERNGGNDTAATATDLGAIGVGQSVTLGTDAIDNRVAPSESDFVSIDGTSDTDVFEFTIPSGVAVDLTLTPLGPTYLSGPQNSDGSCSAGTPFNASTQSNLTLTLLGTDGSTVLQTAADNGLGAADTLQDVSLSAGTYFARITGAQNNAQMYRLDVAVEQLAGVRIVESDGGTVVVEGGGSDTYTIALTQAPAGMVEITATAGSQTQISLDGVAFGNAVTLKLADTNAQTVYVRAVDDADVEGLHAGTIEHAITATADAALYPSGLEIANVVARIADNDLAPFTRLGPLGGGVSVSMGSTTTLSGATAVVDFSLDLEAGETIWVQAQPSAAVTLDVSLVGVTGSFTSPAAGAAAILPVTAAATDDEYLLRIGGDGATDVVVTIFRNTAVEPFGGDSADGSEIALGDSLLPLGAARWAAVGRSTAAPGGLRFVKSNDPSAFVDISSSGQPFTVGDDDWINVSGSSVGNAIFPAGPFTISSNGGISQAHNMPLIFSNQPLPYALVPDVSLMPFWDDLNVGTIYAVETPIDGIPAFVVQWQNRPHFNFGGGVTFQVQIFDSGPIFARFVYQDVVFGNAAVDFGASATIGYQTNLNEALQYSFDTASLANGDVLDLRADPIPDVDEFELDLTGRVGERIDVVLAGVNDADFSAQTLELLAPDGTTVLATGVTDPVQSGTSATNYDLGILDFVVPADGTYTVRISSLLSDANYALVVTADAAFDSEPNTAAAEPRRGLDATGGALGHLDAATDAGDRYAVTLTAGQAYVVETSTPFAATMPLPPHDLDPALEIIHPDGSTVVATDQDSAADGRNARVAFTAPLDGVYQIRVLAVSGAGEYAVRFEPDDVESIGATAGVWQPQGPGSLQNSQVEAAIPNRLGSGAVHAVLAHPTDPEVLYIGAVNGGIWKTTNATSVSPTWVPQTDHLGSLSIGALAFDPTDATYNTLVAGVSNYSSYLGVAGQRIGVLRTTDGGQTWTNPASAGLVVTSGDTTIGENLSGIAARGETLVVTSHTSSGGVFRSTDGGATFAAVSGPDFTSPGADVFDLVVDPSVANGLRLYAGVEDRGIYRSDDFGMTWSKITGAAIDADMNDLLTDPVNNNIELTVHPTTGRLYAAILHSGQPVALYHTNDGQTASPAWTRMDVPVLPITGGAALTGASNTTPIVITAAGHGLQTNQFVLINGVTGNTAANGQFTIRVLDNDRFELNGSAGNGAYAGGGTWTRITGPNPSPKDVDETGAQGRIHFSLTVDPTNENIVYLGGDRQEIPNLIGDNSYSGAVFRGDASIAPDPLAVPSPQWDHLTHDIVAFDPSGGTASGSAPHADSRDMTFDANGNLIEVDDGGVYRRTSPRDNTGDWFSLAGNLATIEFHHVAYDTLSNTLIGGTQDNGTPYQPVAGAAVWDRVFGGDGADVLVDTKTRAAQNESIRYFSAQFLGGLQRSTWDAFGNLVGSVSVPLATISGDPLAPQFYTPLALNHVDPTRLLFGAANGIYESFDQGATVSAVAPGVVASGFTGHPLDYGGFAGATPNPDVAYVGTGGGTVYVRTTSGGPFTATATGGGSIRDVRMVPDDWSTAFALDSDQVFMTDNAGGSWADVTGNLAGVVERFLSLEIITGLVDAVVVGTNAGVFASLTSAIGTWQRLGEELPNALVWDLDYDPADDLLAAGTMGRGAWTLPAASYWLSGLVPTATVDLASGDLVITESTSAAAALTLQADSANSRYVLHLPGGTLATTIAGATGDGTETVTVPFSAVTGEVFVDLLAGGDQLTLDLDPGPLPRPLNYNADGGSLRLTGTTTVADTTIASDGADSGSILLTGSSVVSFVNTATLLSELQATNVVVSGVAAGETLYVAPAGVDLKDTQVVSSVGTDLRFRTPASSLVIDGAGGGDLVRVFGVHDLHSTALEITASAIRVEGSIYARGGQPLTLVGDTLTLFNEARLAGDGPLVIRPLNAGTSIGLGGGGGTLNLNDAELAGLVDGFSSITIGRADGTGPVDVDSTHIHDPLAVYGGQISVTGLDAGPNSVALTATSGAISDGGDGSTDVTASALTLTTQGTTTGRVGAAGDELLVDVATLSVLTAAANGEQFLAAVNPIDVLSLDAGTATAHLVAGDFLLSGATAAATTVRVASGALLGGEGTVLGTLDAAGTIAPGLSPGVLTAGPTTFFANATFAVEIGGATAGSGAGHHDQLSVAGTVAIEPNVTLDWSAFGGFVPAAGQVFRLIDNDGGEAVTGTFAGLAEGATLADFLGSGLDATITYAGGDGNDVVIAMPPANVVTTHVRVVRTPTSTDAGGEAAALPDNAAWLHEWEPFWAEIWITTSATSAGVSAVQLTLDYATSLTTADSVEFNTAFAPIGAPTIDDAAGTITGIHATTGTAGLGDDRPVLLARVRFVPGANDEAAVDVANQSIGPYALLVAPAAALAALDGGTLTGTASAGANVELWAVPYDVDDSGQIDFGDFAFFTPEFGLPVAAERPYSWWADFDRSNLVDFGDLAFFSPNFAKSKPDATLIFPASYPEGWRPAGGGNGGFAAVSGDGTADGSGTSTPGTAATPSIVTPAATAPKPAQLANVADDALDETEDWLVPTDDPDVSRLSPRGRVRTIGMAPLVPVTEHDEYFGTLGEEGEVPRASSVVPTRRLSRGQRLT